MLCLSDGQERLLELSHLRKLVVLIVTNSPVLSPLPDLFGEVAALKKLEPCIAVVHVAQCTAAQFIGALDEHDPDAVVLSGHGDATLRCAMTPAFVGVDGRIEVVDADTLASAIAACLKVRRHQPWLTILTFVSAGPFSNRTDHNRQVTASNC